MLLEMGADVGVRNPSPLHTAAVNKKRKCVDMLLEAGAEVDADALEDVVKEGLLEMVEILGKRAPHLELTSGCNNFTPLHMACQYGHLAVVAKLVELGADVRKKSDEGWDAVNIAAVTGHFEVVNYFVKQLKIEVASLQQSVMYFVDNGDVAALERLLLLGVDLKAIDNLEPSMMEVPTHHPLSAFPY